MAIITLSRGTYSGAQELAIYISNYLGYKVLSRDNVIDQIRQYGMSEEKLSHARQRRLGILERMDLEWIHYLVYLRAVLSKEIQDEALVYHGNRGQAVLYDFPHVLSVRVTADMEYRINALIARLDHAIDPKEAKRLIKKIDEQRAKWTKFLYQSDLEDARGFDLTIDVSRLSIPDAYEIIHTTIELPNFQPSPESKKMIEDMTLAAELRAKIAMEANIQDDNIEVEIRNDIINIKGTVHSLEDADQIREVIRRQPGIEDIQTHLEVPVQEQLRHW